MLRTWYAMNMTMTRPATRKSVFSEARYEEEASVKIWHLGQATDPYLMGSGAVLREVAVVETLPEPHGSPIPPSQHGRDSPGNPKQSEQYRRGATTDP